jgi:hypothetical protein
MIGGKFIDHFRVIVGPWNIVLFGSAMGYFGFSLRRLQGDYFERTNEMLARRGMPVMRRESIVSQSDLYQLMLEVQREKIAADE